MRIFYFGHYEGTMCTPYTFNGAQFIENKILIMFHIPRIYFQYEVIIS